MRYFAHPKFCPQKCTSQVSGVWFVWTQASLQDTIMWIYVFFEACWSSVTYFNVCHFYYFLDCKYCVSLSYLNAQPSVINLNSYTSSNKKVPWTCIIYGRKTRICCINGIERDLRITALKNQYKARSPATNSRIHAYLAVMKSSIENKSSDTRQSCSYVLYKRIDRLGIIVSKRE